MRVSRSWTVVWGVVQIGVAIARAVDAAVGARRRPRGAVVRVGAGARRVPARHAGAVDHRERRHSPACSPGSSSMTVRLGMDDRRLHLVRLHRRDDDGRRARGCVARDRGRAACDAMIDARRRAARHRRRDRRARVPRRGRRGRHQRRSDLARRARHADLRRTSRAIDRHAVRSRVADQGHRHDDRRDGAGAHRRAAARRAGVGVLRGVARRRSRRGDGPRSARACLGPAGAAARPAAGRPARVRARDLRDAARVRRRARGRSTATSGSSCSAFSPPIAAARRSPSCSIGSWSG